MLTTRYHLDEAHLKYYDEKFKSWASSQPVKTLPSSLYPWTLTEKAGAVTCWPVGGTELKPTVDFLFTETGPASGDKSPTNPSTISGVSEVKVTRANSNLIRWPYFDSSGRENNGITWTVNGDGSISATGTSSAGSSFRMQPTDNYLTYGVKLAAGTYRLSGCPAGGAWNSTWAVRSAVYSAGAGKVTLGQDLGNGATVTVTEPSYLAFFCYIWSGNTVSNLTFAPKLQLVEAPFEKNEQDVYTLSLGNTYYGGTLDVASGLMTVTWEAVKLTGNETWVLDSGSTEASSVFQSNLGLPNMTMSSVQNASTRCCSHFPYSGSSSVPYRFMTWGNTTRVYFAGPATVFPDANSFKTFLAAEHAAGHPVILVYLKAAPQTLQLTLPQILALPQPDKYTPRLNTVYTDASTVRVGYVKSPIREEFELQQAVVSQGGEI